MTLPIAIFVARARNGVIGKDGSIPWRLRTDMVRFKANTMGKPVIMGRKTWDSFPIQPLPGRMNIVLSRDGSFEPKTAVPVENFNEAVEMASEQGEEDGAVEVCVIGGTALYELALPRARRLYITEVEAEPEGDAFFPAFDEAAWTEVYREAHEAGEKDDHPFVFRILERRR